MHKLDWQLGWRAAVCMYVVRVCSSGLKHGQRMEKYTKFTIASKINWRNIYNELSIQYNIDNDDNIGDSD